MSGTASVPNTFASAVTATGAQLDANYDTIVAYINNPTNRNNYAADGAATNTVVLTFAPPVVGGYTAGLELTWKWGVTNTGAVVLNANGLGNVNVVNPDGSALQAAQGVAGSIGKAVYDGTRAVYISASAQKRGEAKAWGHITGTTASYGIVASYGVTSVARGGVGTCTVVLVSAFSSGNYSMVFGGSARFFVPVRAPGTVVVSIFNNSVVPEDAPFDFAIFGDLP